MGGCDGSGAAADLPADAPAHVREAVVRCSGLDFQEKRDCYTAELLQRLEEHGVADALSALETVSAADREVERDGHVYTHAIGIEAYRLNPSMPDVFPECTELFQSGCYHGVIQAHFMAHGSVEADDLNSLCAAYKGEGADRWVLFQCLHGLGHGLTMFYGHDLPLALEGCDLLTEWWDRQSCYGGAFMENVMTVVSPHHPAAELTPAEGVAGGAEHEREPAAAMAGEMAEGEHQPGEAMAEGAEREPAEAMAGMAEHEHGPAGGAAALAGREPWKALDPDDPLYPCSVLEDRYLQQCYLMQTSAILYYNGGDIGQAARVCDSAPDAYRPVCYISLGRDISAYTLRDIDRSMSLCNKGHEAYRRWCYIGLVKNFIDVSATTERSFAFCRKVEKRDDKLPCYQAIGEEVGVLTQDMSERARLCAASEGIDYEEACRRGARVTPTRPTDAETS